MKKTYWLPVLSGIIFCLVYIYAFDSKLDLNGDNANYLRFAQSMAQGHGYSSPSINGPMPASQYPPAYSAVLSVFMRLGIDNLIFFKVLNGLLLAASLFLLYYITLKTTGNRALAFAPTLLVVFCPELQHFANIVMSEMLFLFFTALCFFACYHQSHAERPFWKSPWFYVVILATTGAYYTRTVGMALVLGVLVFYLFRKEWKQALVSLAGIVLLNIPWSVRNAVNGIESRYFGTIMTVNPWRPEEGQIASFGDLFEKMLHNFDETVIKGFKDLLFPFMTVNYDTPSTFPAVIGGLCIVAFEACHVFKTLTEGDAVEILPRIDYPVKAFPEIHLRNIPRLMAEISRGLKRETQIIQRIERQESLDCRICASSLRGSYIKGTSDPKTCLKSLIAVSDSEEQIDGISKILMGSPVLIGLEAEAKDDGRSCSLNPLEV